VLHALQKKAKKGIVTPQQDIELIKLRLRNAELHYRTLTERETASHEETQNRS
jgi:phage-related protein